MAGLYARFETSKDLEKDGVILDLGQGVEIVVARAGLGNPRFDLAQRRISAPLRAQLLRGDIDTAVARKMTIDIYAEAVVLGWKNVTDRDGNDLPFTRENVVRVLTDLPDVFESIVQMATSSAAYKKNLVADEGKD